MSEPSLHLPDWTLELYAEGELPEAEQESAAAHLAKCARCSAELEAYQTLFAELGELPRYAPAAGFSAGVMARVQIAPPPRLEVWLQRWLPTTRRAWAIFLGVVTAPAVPIVALIVWLMSQPMVTAGSLAGWAAEWVRGTAWSAVGGAASWFETLGVSEWAAGALSAAGGLSQPFVAAVALVLAIGIPLSVWSLVRLVRTPDGDMLHAN